VALDTTAHSALAALDEPARAATSQDPSASAPPRFLCDHERNQPIARPGADRLREAVPRRMSCQASGHDAKQQLRVRERQRHVYRCARGRLARLGLVPTVEAVATAHGWRLIVFAKMSCPFLDIPDNNGILGREYAECDTWNSNVISALRANPPDLIIISMWRWMAIVKPMDNVTSEGESLPRMIEKLPGASRKLIIQDVPTPDKVVPTRLSANLDDYRRCAYPRATSFGSGMGQREKIAAQATGASLVDLTAEICPGTGDCPVVIDNMIVWRDLHHLTATFAASLGPSLDVQIRAVRAWP
jgi:hypothetical protein